MKIMNVKANYGEATHDSFIWKNSNVREFLKQKFEALEQNTWLLGYNSYPQEPWLMTPIVYMNAHTQTRNIVERCFLVRNYKYVLCTHLQNYCFRFIENEISVHFAGKSVALRTQKSRKKYYLLPCIAQYVSTRKFAI